MRGRVSYQKLIDDLFLVHFLNEFEEISVDDISWLLQSVHIALKEQYDEIYGLLDLRLLLVLGQSFSHSNYFFKFIWIERVSYLIFQEEVGNSIEFFAFGLWLLGALER